MELENIILSEVSLAQEISPSYADIRSRVNTTLDHMIKQEHTREV
jgi:hypothetical protein